MDDLTRSCGEQLVERLQLPPSSEHASVAVGRWIEAHPGELSRT
jgi:hypothetical protein